MLESLQTRWRKTATSRCNARRARRDMNPGIPDQEAHIAVCLMSNVLQFKTWFDSKYEKKVKQSHYSPAQALRVPGG
jgi:hypothetical protein